jgi:hypothetical protein
MQSCASIGAGWTRRSMPAASCRPNTRSPHFSHPSLPFWQGKEAFPGPSTMRAPTCSFCMLPVSSPVCAVRRPSGCCPLAALLLPQALGCPPAPRPLPCLAAGCSSSAPSAPLSPGADRARAHWQGAAKMIAALWLLLCSVRLNGRRSAVPVRGCLQAVAARPRATETGRPGGTAETQGAHRHANKASRHRARRTRATNVNGGRGCVLMRLPSFVCRFPLGI